MRATLSAACKKLHESGVLKRMGDVLAHVKAREEKGQIMHNVVGKSAEISYRRAGRLSIVVSWAVDEITSFVPKEPKQLISFTQDIITKLRSKGFVLHTLEKVSKDRMLRVIYSTL